MQLSAFGDLSKEATAVGFAGFGGACEGIRMAIGASPIVAINHDEHAIRLHELNHPETKHYREDIWLVDPWRACRGRKLKLLWLSPDCTHHSRAKGKAPRMSGRRSLADVVFKWVSSVRPAVIMLENVPEWLDWGPLDEHGKPISERKGELFRAWVSRLESHGYRVEWRVLRACDYGVPTSRERVYLVARCDGQPIAWPAPTHGPGLLPYRIAAECIDWSIPCPSIFGRKKPLADKTMRRIAAGLVKFVLKNKRPFIVHHRGQSVGRDVEEPMPTVTSTGMGHLGVVSPQLLCLSHGGRNEDITDPLNTITSTPKGGDRALVGVSLVQTGYGEREGQAPRVMDLHAPLTTVVAGGQKHGLVTAWLAKHYGGVTGQPLDQTLGTVTTVDHHSLCTATLEAVESTHAQQIASFLVKYYGAAVGQPLGSPLDTVTTVDRFGLVTVTIDGQTYAITDIGMRMLQPRELARAMGFPDSYILEGSKRDQVARIGNAVCPQMAEALVRANIGGI